MHKRSYSVFGRIDFFSVMRQLLVSLGGSLDEAWAVSSPELSKVIIPDCFASTRCHISDSQHVLLFIRLFRLAFSMCELSPLCAPSYLQIGSLSQSI